MKKKPAGIVAIIVYNLFGAVLCFGLGGLMMLAGSLPQMPASVAAISIFYIFIGVLNAVSTYGLWQFEEWARMMTVIVYGLSVPISIFGAVTGEGVSLKLINAGCAITSIIIVCYLTQNHIITLFKKNEASIPSHDFTHDLTTVKYCEQCGSGMKKRVKQSGNDSGKSFWVCSKYPTCRNCFPC